MKHLLIILSILILNGCSGTQKILSPKGSQLKIVSENDIDCCCENKGIVTASQGYGIGWSVTEANESALNEVRNKAAKSGGNSIKIIEANSTGDPFNGGGITYIAGVYICDYDKINN